MLGPQVFFTFGEDGMVQGLEFDVFSSDYQGGQQAVFLIQRLRFGVYDLGFSVWVMNIDFWK